MLLQQVCGSDQQCHVLHPHNQLEDETREDQLDPPTVSPPPTVRNIDHDPYKAIKQSTTPTKLQREQKIGSIVGPEQDARYN